MKAKFIILACIFSLLKQTGAAIAADTAPAASGAMKVIRASWLGGAGSDSIAAARIGRGGIIILAGNTTDPKFPACDLRKIAAAAPPAKPAKPAGKPREPDEVNGWIARLTDEGSKSLGGVWLENIRIASLKLDAGGVCYLLCDSPGEFDLAGVKGHGRFIARLSENLESIEAVFRPAEDLWNFDVDANGDILVLCAGHLYRHSPDGKTQKWSASFAAFGDNRPGGIAVNQKTGVTVIDGFGMTKTGHVAPN